MKPTISRTTGLKLLAALLLAFGFSIGCASDPPALTPGVDYDVPAQEKFVLLVKQDGQLAKRWIVIDIVQPANRPRNAYVEGRVHVFDNKDNHLTSENFVPDAIGFIENVTAGPHPNLPGVVVRIDTTSIDMNDKRRFYFALVDDRLTLIRAEDRNSKVLGESLRFARWSFEPEEQVKTTAAQWKGRLLSDDPAQVLAALAWLSGSDKDGWKTPEKYAGWRNEWSEVTSIGAVLHDTAVQTRLDELTNSENQWIRQASHFVLETK